MVPPLKKLSWPIFSTLFRVKFSEAFPFCLCLLSSLPVLAPKIRYFPCFFFPTHIFLLHPHILPESADPLGERHSVSNTDFYSAPHLPGRTFTKLTCALSNSICLNQTVVVVVVVLQPPNLHVLYTSAAQNVIPGQPVSASAGN